MNFSIHPKHKRICCRLLETGTLRKSECGQSLVRAIQPLLDNGILRWERSAAGQRLAIMDRTALERWLRKIFPDGQVDEMLISSRIHAVAQFRDTKALRSNLPEIVHVRSISDGALLRGGVSVQSTRPTKEHGVFAFDLEDPTPYALHGSCALIENPAVFHQFEKLQLEPTLAILTNGMSSNRLVAWLSKNVRQGLRVLHLPDYDSIGLSEFVRLHNHLGESISLFLPNHLNELFRRHCNPALLNDPKNQRMLGKLRKSRHPSVQQVVAMIDECNGGLEHEALFVENSSDG